MLFRSVLFLRPEDQPSDQPEGRAVGNDVEADGNRLIMITGANQGGKSTFLGSVGLAQLMMQCGLFVAAESFTASVSPGASPTSCGKRTPPWSGASWTRN